MAGYVERAMPILNKGWMEALSFSVVNYYTPPKPAYFNWTWDEEAEKQADQDCLDDL